MIRMPGSISGCEFAEKNITPTICSAVIDAWTWVEVDSFHEVACYIHISRGVHSDFIPRIPIASPPYIRPLEIS